MRKGILSFLTLLVTLSVCCQDLIPTKVPGDSIRKEQIDADGAVSKMLRMTKDEVHKYLNGATRICTDSIYSDIYFVYSSREKKNIPIEFFYGKYFDDEYRVYKVEFVSRKSKYYKPTDLRAAFWIEYIRHK